MFRILICLFSFLQWKSDQQDGVLDGDIKGKSDGTASDINKGRDVSTARDGTAIGGYILQPDSETNRNGQDSKNTDSKGKQIVSERQGKKQDGQSNDYRDAEDRKGDGDYEDDSYTDVAQTEKTKTSNVLSQAIDTKAQGSESLLYSATRQGKQAVTGLKN